MQSSQITEDAFYQMLRAGLWSAAERLANFAPLTSDEWSRIINLSLATGTLGIVTDGVAMLPDELQPPRELRMRMLTAKLQIAAQHRLHNSAIREIMGMLDRIKIPSLLLKGQGIAREYIDPTTRACGDIDIYIGEENINRVIDYLTERGITCTEEIDDNEKHAVLYYNGIGVELHRHSTILNTPKTNKRYQRWWDDAFLSERCERFYIDAKGNVKEEAAPNCQVVRVAAPEQAAFFLFFHVFHHFTSTQIQFRQFCDLARYLSTHRDKIDRDALTKAINELHLLGPWCAIGCFLHYYIGLDKDAIPLFDDQYKSKADAIAQRLRNKCMNRRAPRWKRPKGRIASKIYSYIYDILDIPSVTKVFPKEGMKAFSSTTAQGLKILFRKSNRTGIHQAKSK